VILRQQVPGLIGWPIAADVNLLNVMSCHDVKVMMF